MAKAEKYRINFKTLQGQDARVEFYFEGFTGATTELRGGIKPFVLKEFNTNDDLFKPIRPQMAEIEIVGSASGVSIDNFLMDKDNDIEVIFYYDSLVTPYWRGWLLQDDFQEIWEDTNHILIIRAIDGLGYNRDFQLSNAGAEVTAKTTPLQYIEYCTANAVKDWNKFYCFNNLFHPLMTDSATYTSLDQCTIDPKTFQIQSTEYESSLEVLDKINRGFNQNLFMYNDNWWLMRMEELYVPKTENLRGFVENSSVRTAINTRYDINVGNDEDIKLISPSAIRNINRRTKENSVTFNYEQIGELITNGTFSRGSLLTTTAILKQYNLNSFDYKYTATPNPDYWGFGGTTPPTGSVTRNEEWSNTSYGYLEDNYVRVPGEQVITTPYDYYLRSQEVKVFTGEKLVIGIDYKFETDFTEDGFFRQMVVMLDGAANNYFLGQDGKWYLTTSTFTINTNTDQEWFIGTKYNQAGSPEPTEYVSLNVESEPIPDNGVIKIAFILDYHALLDSTNEMHIKALNFEIIEQFNGISAQPLVGVKTAFTKTDTLYNKQENDIFLQDGFSWNYKGTLLNSGGTSILDSTWYRYRFPTEEMSFRKENNIAYWENTRFNRTKLDANFYGILNNGDRIGLHNTVIFVDDDPDKVYAIVNLKEIDFASATWSATLLEVWDENKDGFDLDNKTFDADVTTGTYNNPVNVPWTVVTAADFSIVGGYQITYNGIVSINEPIVISLAGNINTTSPAPLPPVSTTFRVKQNGVTIKTQTYPVSTNPQAFTFNLSPSGTITINPSDVFTVEVSNNITQIQYTSGAFTIDYQYPGTLTYDTFSEKYIYNK